MLLTYLYANFYEKKTFLEKTGIDSEKLDELIKNRIVPKPSYILNNNINSTSFIGEFNLNECYEFHLKGHISWLEAVEELCLFDESRAKLFFRYEYENASNLFFSGPTGKDWTAIMPSLKQEFNEIRFSATWQHFLNGVYGVCTCDGMPKSIFLKQVGATFLEFFSNEFNDANVTDTQRAILGKAVSFLDNVEAEFAPHEVGKTSRKRCIIDVREKYHL